MGEPIAEQGEWDRPDQHSVEYQAVLQIDHGNSEKKPSLGSQNKTIDTIVRSLLGQPT